jgi:uncharacterized protein YycO
MRRILVRKIKRWALWLMIPIQKWFQRRGRRETIMTKKIVGILMSEIRPGDILLSYEAQRYTSIFIKGFYDHAVIVSSRGTVVEAVGDYFINGYNVGGVREVPLEEWLYKKDHVALVRVKIKKGLVDKAAEHSLKYIGRNYDYCFSSENETVYCSELAYLCYREVWPPFFESLDEDREILPQMYIDFGRFLWYLDVVLDTKEMSLG